MREWIPGMAVAVLLAGAIVSGQAPEAPVPPYVASVKPNTSDSGSSFTRRLPGGTFLASNMAVRDLVAFAYGLQPFQVEGLPEWAQRRRFDITMKAEENVGPVAIGPTQIGLRLARAVLAERFAFQSRRETRERPAFALVRASPNGPLGPRIRQSPTDCAALAAEAGKTGAPWPPRRADGRLLCGLNTTGLTLTAGGYPMAEFQKYLTGQTQRVVIDRTGLTGTWDFDLTFAPAETALAAAADTPSIFTALQEQLGLKLDSQKGPVSVLVIDRAEHPDEN
jgi:uncharacterized protein (TIGR03435 family)